MAALKCQTSAPNVSAEPAEAVQWVYCNLSYEQVTAGQFYNTVLKCEREFLDLHKQ